jgi:PAS domain-containing protein
MDTPSIVVWRTPGLSAPDLAARNGDLVWYARRLQSDEVVMTEIIQRIGPDALKAVMAFSLDAIVTKTRQGVITGWNAYAADLYGYPAEEIIGRDATVLLPPGWQSEEADLRRTAPIGSARTARSSPC